MYTGLTWQYQDRYKYNAYKILNINPNYLPESDYLSETYINSCKNQVNNNVENLISKLSDQLTFRQKAALREISDILRKQWDFSKMFGIHEFRFEGAGCYQNGNGGDDTYNTAEVSSVSVDFRNLGGSHIEAGFPSNFNDGFGLYGAMSVIYRNGEILSVFTRASTLPDQMEIDDTVAGGTYYFKVDYHYPPGGTAYKALRLYVDSACTNNQLPTAIDNVSPNGVAYPINSHKGYINMRGSEGCQTLQHDQNNENDYLY